MINIKNLGCQNLEGFVSREEVKDNLHKHFKMAFIGAGQAGGKIAAEFIRLGYYASIYNTCKEDIDDVDRVLKSLEDIEYNTIRLEGYDGASKDREIGLKAIKDNIKLIEKELMADKHLLEADFVWIIAALGGGTGCGSISTVAQIVSGIMRKNKRYMGKPTVGIIAATPEIDSKQKQMLNSAKALQEIKQLQEKKIIGSCLIIDNDKLIEDFLKDDTNYTDWTTYGNTTTARLITELASFTCLPARETLDKSELMDIISTPGFLNIGKLKIGSIANENSDALIEKSFKNANVFADGYNFEFALHGGMAVLIPGYGSDFNIKDSIKLKKSMNKFLDTPLVDVTHFGVFENNVFGSLKEPRNMKMVTNANAIIYTLAVVKELPSKIFDMTKEALEKEKEKQDKLNSYENNELDNMLSSLEYNAHSENNIELSLDSIFGGDLFKDDNINVQSDDDYDPMKELFKKQ